MSFAIKLLPWNVVFGTGARAGLAGQLDSLGYARPLMLCTPGRAELAGSLQAALAGRCSEIFALAATHTPLPTVEAAIRAYEDFGGDCTIAVGGGSTIGLGKALALKRGIPNVAVPTTYSGSEMTNIWGFTDGGRKHIGRDTAVLPRLTVYDPELTLDLPPAFSGASGMNALAQAVVNVTVPEPNPVLLLWALEAIRKLSASLPEIAEQPGSLAAREQALYGSFLAGAVIGIGATSLHHKLCHTLGGAFGTPHAETHALLLPHTVAFNSAVTPEGTRLVARALGVEDAAAGLLALARRVGAWGTLRDLGLDAADLDEAARLATATPISNPRPTSFESVRALLQRAFEGVVARPGDEDTMGEPPC